MKISAPHAVYSCDLPSSPIYFLAASCTLLRCNTSLLSFRKFRANHTSKCKVNKRAETWMPVIKYDLGVAEILICKNYARARNHRAKDMKETLMFED